FPRSARKVMSSLATRAPKRRVTFNAPRRIRSSKAACAAGTPATIPTLFQPVGISLVDDVPNLGLAGEDGLTRTFDRLKDRGRDDVLGVLHLGQADAVFLKPEGDRLAALELARGI